MGQGNVFTPICHSVHGGKVYTPSPRHTLPAWADTPARQTSPPDQTPSWADASLADATLADIPPGRHPSGRHHPPGPADFSPPAPDGYCSGWYVSYRNAFLYSKRFIITVYEKKFQLCFGQKILTELEIIISHRQQL